MGNQKFTQLKPSCTTSVTRILPYCKVAGLQAAPFHKEKETQHVGLLSFSEKLFVFEVLVSVVVRSNS